MGFHIIITNPLAAGSHGSWENDFLLECSKTKCSARPPSSRSPRAYRAPRPPPPSRDTNRCGRGSGTAAVAHYSWPLVDPCVADAMDDISDDDADSDDSGNQEEGSREPQQLRFGVRGANNNGLVNSAWSSSSGAYNSGGNSGGRVSEVRKGTPREAHAIGWQNDGFVHDDEGGIDCGGTSSYAEDFIELETDEEEDGNCLDFPSRQPGVRDTDDEADEMQGAAAGWTAPCDETDGRRKTYPHRKEAVARTAAISKKKSPSRAVRPASNRGLARSTPGGAAPKAALFRGGRNPEPSPAPSPVGTSVDESQSSCAVSEEGQWSSSEADTESDDSDDYEPDVLPPNCSGLHKDRKTYKSALCLECYIIYIRKLKEAGLNVSDVDSDAEKRRHRSRQNRLQQSERDGKGKRGRAKGGKRNGPQKRPSESHSSNPDDNGGSSRSRKKRPKVSKAMSGKSTPIPTRRGPPSNLRKETIIAPNIARERNAWSSEGLDKGQGGTLPEGSSGSGAREGPSSGRQGDGNMKPIGRLGEEHRPKSVITSVRSGNKQNSSRQDLAETPAATESSTMPSSLAPPTPRNLSWQRLAGHFGHRFGGDSVGIDSEGRSSAELAGGRSSKTFVASTVSATKTKTAPAQGKALRSTGGSSKIPRKFKNGSELSASTPNDLPKKKHQGRDERPPIVLKGGSGPGGLKDANSPFRSSLNKTKTFVVDKAPDDMDDYHEESSQTHGAQVGDQSLDSKEAGRAESTLDVPGDPPHARGDNLLRPLAAENISHSISSPFTGAPPRQENFSRPFFAPEEVIQDQRSSGAAREQQPLRSHITGQSPPPCLGASLEEQNASPAKRVSIGTPVAGSSTGKNLGNADRDPPVDVFGQPRDLEAEHAVTDEDLYNREVLPLPSESPHRSQPVGGGATRATPSATTLSAQTCPWLKFWSWGDSDKDPENQRAGEPGRVEADRERPSALADPTIAHASPRACVSGHAPHESNIHDARDSSVSHPRATVPTVAAVNAPATSSSPGPEGAKAAAAVKASTTSSPGPELALSCASSASWGLSDGENWDGILGSWEAGTRSDAERPSTSVLGGVGDARGIEAASAPAPAETQPKTRAAVPIHHDVAHPQENDETAGEEMIWPVMQPKKYAPRSWKEERPGGLKTNVSRDGAVWRSGKEQMISVFSDGGNPESREEGRDDLIPASLLNPESGVKNTTSSDSEEREKDAAKPLAKGFPSIPTTLVAWGTPKKILTTAVAGEPYFKGPPGGTISSAAVPQQNHKNSERTHGDGERFETIPRMDEEGGHEGESEELSLSHSRDPCPGPNTPAGNDDSDGYSVGQRSDQDISGWM